MQYVRMGRLLLLFGCLMLVSTYSVAFSAWRTDICGNSNNKGDISTKQRAQDYSKKLTGLQRTETLHRFFEECLYQKIKERSKHNYTVKNLVDLYDAIQISSFYTSSRKQFSILYDVYKSLSNLDFHDKSIDLSMYNGLVSGRFFERANEVAQKLQETSVSLMPKLISDENLNDTDRSVMSISMNGQQMKRKLFNYPTGSYIVVVGHPDCHFTVNAFTAIQNDLGLMRRLKNHLLLIMPTIGGLASDSVHEWNNNHHFKMNYIFDQDNWTEIDEWETPIFYFIQNGKVVHKTIGWPKRGHINEINRALAAIGL